MRAVDAAVRGACVGIEGLGGDFIAAVERQPFGAAAEVADRSCQRLCLPARTSPISKAAPSAA
jgi:hypothetical protein